MNLLYGVIGILGTLFAAIAFLGFLVSCYNWDIESAIVCGVVFAFFAFLSGLMGHLMEKMYARQSANN